MLFCPAMKESRNKLLKAEKAGRTPGDNSKFEQATPQAKMNLPLRPNSNPNQSTSGRALSTYFTVS